jgi:SOS response regulatory protein OraA/RecX
MAAHGARRLKRMVANLDMILGIEAICAGQGIDQRAPLQTAPPLRAALAALRQKGIADIHIRMGLQEINATEYLQVLHRLTEKTWKQYTREDKDKRITKVRASLMRKGFEPELVSRAVTQLANSAK